MPFAGEVVGDGERVAAIGRCGVDFDADIAPLYGDGKLDLAHGEILSGNCLELQPNRSFLQVFSCIYVGSLGHIRAP